MEEKQELFDATVSALAQLMDSVDGCYEFAPWAESDCGMSEDEQFDEAVLTWDNARVVLDKVRAWRRKIYKEQKNTAS